MYLLQPACRRGAVTFDSRPEFPEHVAGLLENISPCLFTADDTGSSLAISASVLCWTAGAGSCTF